MAMGIDLEIISSRIERIEIEIPWMTMFSDNMKVKIKGVEISVISKPQTSNSHERVFKVQEMGKLKSEALKHTEESYLKKNKHVSHRFTSRNLKKMKEHLPTSTLSQGWRSH